jgi:hypothetical protein
MKKNVTDVKLYKKEQFFRLRADSEATEKKKVGRGGPVLVRI